MSRTVFPPEPCPACGAMLEKPPVLGGKCRGCRRRLVRERYGDRRLETHEASRIKRQAWRWARLRRELVTITTTNSFEWVVMMVGEHDACAICRDDHGRGMRLVEALERMPLPHSGCRCAGRRKGADGCQCFWVFRDAPSPSELELVEAAIAAEAHYRRFVQELQGGRLGAHEIAVANAQADALLLQADPSEYSIDCQRFIALFATARDGRPKLYR